MMRLQFQNPSKQRQRRVGAVVEAAGRTCGIGRAQHDVDSGHRHFASAQDFGDRIGLRPRCGQRACQRQLSMRRRERAALRRAARLLHRRLRNPGQPRAQFGAIRIDRDGRLVQLARAAAVVGAQSPLLQCFFCLLAQRFGFRHRPQALGDRFTQREQQRHQQGDGDRQGPRPVRAENPTER